MDVFDLFAKIVLDTDEYERSLKVSASDTKAFSNKLKSGLAAVAKVGAAAMGAASAAVTAFAKFSIDAGAQFDSSMSQVAATMGTTVDQIGELRDFAMEMGAKTAFSASQAADALNYMALAGYDASQSMEALPNVLNLAAAGGIELAQASDMVTDAQSALGLSMKESAELVDKMAKASSKSNTSVAQLGEAILTIGGTAKNLAGGTTELSTALGILADNGVKGAEGGTALRNIILSLSAPTDTAAAAMESLGVKVYDANGNMRPLNDTFRDLDAALSTMTQGQQTEVLNKIFNKVDLKSVNALLANTGERFDELSGYIDNAAGAAEAMAATQLDNLTGDVTLFKSALESVQISLSDKLTPTIRTVVQAATDFLSNFNVDSAVSAIENLIDTFVEFTPVIAGATAAVGAYKAAMTISSFVDAAVKSIKAYQTANEGATAAQALLNTTLLANPFVLVATLVAALGAALVTLYMTNEDFRNKVNAAWASVKETISNAVSAIVTFFTETVPTAAQKAVDWFNSIPDKMKEIGQNILTGLWNGISDKVEWLKGKVGGVVGGIIERFTGKEGFDEHSPSKVFRTIGQYMMEGLAIGMEDSKGEVMETIEDIVGEVKSRFTALTDVLTARQDVGDLEYQLWERTVGANATESEKYEKQLELLNNQQRDQESVVEAAAAAYEAIITQYGDSSAESYEYQKTLLQEMLAYQDLVDQINDVIKAKQELASMDGVSTISFEDSTAAKTSAATINAISESGVSGTQDVTLNATLVAPDGTKFANYYLPSFIKAGAANGTPISSGQYA